MRIIISPAKKMNQDTDTLPWRALPAFLPQAKQLMEMLRKLTYEQCKAVWKCNDKIAELNYRRLQEMEPESCLTPAILSYEGIQYQYMAPAVLEEDALEYLQTHLRILSGFYGILKPFDGIVPYRLEMQAKLRPGNGDCKEGQEELPASLYDFWKDTMAQSLLAEDSVILNLASKEYSKCISSYLTGDTVFITCVFGELINGRVVEKGTLAKMARGEMVRFLAQKKIEEPEGVKAFQGLGYRFYPEWSRESTYVFLKDMQTDGYTE